MKKYRPLTVILLILVVSVAIFLVLNVEKTTNSAILTKVKFGMLPYADHSYAIIGAQQGWFKEIGIDLDYQTIKVEEIIPLLKNGTLDIVSTPPGILFSSYENAPNLCSFVFGDLFQGYAIMAQPSAGYSSYKEFVARGLTPEKALIATIKQIKGKVFAYPTETAIKPFIDLVLEKANMSTNDFDPLVLDDPLTVNAMRDKRADFQVGGVPSRIVLQREGFIPIISAIDVAIQARPSSDSKELASIMQNGWATRKDVFKNNRPTLLRMASVNYRIMKYMNTNMIEALSIHMPYLSKITGQSFTAKEGEVIYKSLNPFITFEQQKTWFQDTTSPLFYEYVNGSILKSFISQNIYKVKAPSVNDVIYADDIYNELDSLRKSSEDYFARIQSKDALRGNDTLSELYRLAKHYYDIYDYYDCDIKVKEIISLIPN